MPADLISFTLFAFSSIILVVNPLSALLVYNSITEFLDAVTKKKVASHACRTAAVVLIFFTFLGSALLSLFGITISAFTIAGGVLLFGIGMEMVYARTSRAKLTTTEKYESIDAEDISSMPLAFPMISGPGTITTVIVLSKDAPISTNPIGFAIILGSVILTLIITYLILISSDYITKKVGIREYRVANRLMGIMLMAIAVQFIINGISEAFPMLVATG
jgi:multiple antibiotic resistance protein